MATKEKEKTNLQRLQEAWENAPTGAKSRVFESFGYSQQNVTDVLKNGRKDESIILSLIQAVKQASADVVKEVYDKNNLVQSI